MKFPTALPLEAFRQNKLFTQIFQKYVKNVKNQIGST